MSATPTKPPWEQLKGESSSDFGKFMFYMSLPFGARSLRRAHRLHLASKGYTTDPANPPALPGSWIRAASRWGWRERAAAFDAQHLVKFIDAAMLEYATAVRLMSRQLRRFLRKKDSAPASFGQALETIKFLSELTPVHRLTPETGPRQ